MPKKDVGHCEKPRGAVNRRYIRGYPNGETHQSEPLVSPSESIGGVKGTWGTETSKYIKERKRKKTEIKKKEKIKTKKKTHKQYWLPKKQKKQKKPKEESAPYSALWHKIKIT